MTDYASLNCTRRVDTGSNASRQLRHRGLVPATVYGHGEPVSLVIDLHHFRVIEHSSKSGSQLVNLLIDDKESGIVLVKKVQRDMIKMTPLHIDLQRISLTEELQVSVALVLDGEPAGVAAGGMLEVMMHSLRVRCAAGKVPDRLTHDVSAMNIGDTLDAGAIALPEGSTLLDRPEECVALIRQPMRVAETTDAEAVAPTDVAAETAEE